MKKILITIGAIIVLGAVAFLIWTKSPFIKEEIQQPMSEVKVGTEENVGVETGFALSEDIANGTTVSRQEVFDEKSGWITNTLGTCVFGLKAVQPIKINDVIKNCTQKNKIGLLPGGLGGIDYDIHIVNDTLVIIDPFLSNLENVSGPLICSWKEERGGEKTVYAKEVIDGYPIAMRNILGKGLLSSIASFGYSSNIYCPTTDPECGEMINVGGRSDGKNYFVAGYREIIDKRFENNNTYLTGYFVINDKLYESEGREFGGIKNGKIIVKKLENLIENQDNMQTSFTLKTCEIDI